MSDDEWKTLAPNPASPELVSSKAKKRKGKKNGKKKAQKKHKKKAPKNGLYIDKKYYNEPKEEKRLDGSPNSYHHREGGKYGSHPIYDDHNEESKPYPKPEAAVLKNNM
jgi:hypothetical protein